MKFFLNWLRNLALMLLIGVVIYIGFPDLRDMLGQVGGVYKMLFGPLILIIVAVSAMPRRRWR